MIVFVLIFGAAGMALAAQLTDTFYLSVAAVAVALLSVLLIAARTWAARRARHEPVSEQSTDEQENDQPTDDADREPATSDNEDAASADSLPEDHETTHDGDSAMRIDLVHDEVDTVRIIPGRKRFHSSVCSSLAGGRESEELTLEEAEEEGFTPCTLCTSNSGNPEESANPTFRDTGRKIRS